MIKDYTIRTHPTWVKIIIIKVLGTGNYIVKCQQGKMHKCNLYQIKSYVGESDVPTISDEEEYFDKFQNKPDESSKIFVISDWSKNVEVNSLFENIGFTCENNANCRPERAGHQ